jgi:hypothetical protein
MYDGLLLDHHGLLDRFDTIRAREPTPASLDRAGLDVAYLRRPHNADTCLDPDPTYEVGGLDEVADILSRA